MLVKVGTSSSWDAWNLHKEELSARFWVAEHILDEAPTYSQADILACGHCQWVRASPKTHYQTSYTWAIVSQSTLSPAREHAWFWVWSLKGLRWFWVWKGYGGWQCKERASQNTPQAHSGRKRTTQKQKSIRHTDVLHRTEGSTCTEQLWQEACALRLSWYFAATCCKILLQSIL